ncbi:MAG: polymerase, partial [Comamonadaceae bacterium]
VAIAFALLRPAGATLDRSALAGGIALVLVALASGRGIGARRDEGSATPIAAAWLVAASISGAIGLLQAFDLAALLQPWLHAAAPGEAIGNLRQRNQLASLLAIGFAASLWFASQGARLRWLVPMVLVLAVATAATTSRTGLLHWLLLSVLAVLWAGASRRRIVLLCGAGLAAYGVAVLGLPALLERVADVVPANLVTRVATDLGCSSRTVLWSNVLELIAQRPLLGWGWGELDYAHYMHLYSGPRFCDILDNAHNLPLHIAVELGIPAALLFCGAVAGGIWRGRPWAERDPQRQLAWSVVAVIGVHSLLEYPLWYAPFQIALGLALGLLLARPPAEPAAMPMPARGRSLVVAGCALLLAYAGWDYLRVSQIYLEPQQRLAPWRDDTLAHVRRSWLFAGQAGFAELTLTDLTPRTVHRVDALAQAMLHYSPEPRVIEKALESATMQERDDDAVLHLARYRTAFPDDYARWRKEQKLPIGLRPQAP